MMWRDDTKYFNSRQQMKKKCKHCGHTQPLYFAVDHAECKWCRHFIFRSELDEFKYRVKESQIKERKNER